MADLMPMVHAERASLSEFLDTLAPQQWSAPTWCDKWNVQELVAHLTAAGNITAPHFLAGFLKAGFNFDKMNAKGVRSEADRTPAELVAELRAVAPRKTRPGTAMLGEALVHQEQRGRRALSGDVEQLESPSAELEHRRGGDAAW